MNEFYFLREVFLLIILLAAGISDITSHTIPNVLPVSSLPVCMILGILAPQKPNSRCIVMILVLLGLFLFLFEKRKLGGGDVKLFFMIACLYPTGAGIRIITGSFVINLLLGAVLFFKYGSKKIPLAAGTFLSALLVFVFFGGYQ